MRTWLREHLGRIDINTWLNAGAAFVGAIAAAILTVVLTAWFARPDSTAPFPPVERDVIDKLERISNTAEYKIEPSTAINDSLSNLLLKANHQLVEHYSALDRKEQKDPKTDVVYFMGPAGAGKSTLLKAFRAEEACYVDLKESFKSGGQLAKYGALKPDLQVGSWTINELPGPSGQSFSLSDILASGGCCTGAGCKRLVILDALDELHPELSKSVLKVIDADLRSKAGPFPSWLLVAGRPEGFYYYLTDRSTVPTGVTTIQFVLPKYRTSGELNVLLKDFYGNQHRVVTTDDEKAFADLVSNNPWLSYTLGYLTYARSLNDYVRLNTHEVDENLKDVMFDNILNSNSQSHQRPKGDQPVYVGLLEEIAAKYAKNASENDGGYFLVPFQDTIPVFADDQTRTRLGTLPVREILNRSGVAYLDPADNQRTRFRFQPLWMHSYLADRWNRRSGKLHGMGYWILKTGRW
jgi:hypothetical protein